MVSYLYLLYCWGACVGSVRELVCLHDVHVCKFAFTVTSTTTFQIIITTTSWTSSSTTTTAAAAAAAAAASTTTTSTTKKFFYCFMYLLYVYNDNGHY